MEHRFKIARTLEEAVAFVVPQPEGPCDASSEGVHSSGKNAELFSREATKELDQAKKAIRRQRELEQLSLQKIDEYHAQVELHNELSLRQENRVKAAEEPVNRLKRQLQYEQDAFKTAMATSPSQSKRRHRLLSNSDIADVSSSARLRQRNEDLHEQVKRLIQANKVFRARVKLEEMDPDVLVLVTEDSLSCLSTGELNWDLLGVSNETRAVLRTVFKNADSSRPSATLADDLARAAYMEGDDLELSSESQRGTRDVPDSVLATADASCHAAIGSSTNSSQRRGSSTPTKKKQKHSPVPHQTAQSPSPRRSRRLTSTSQSDCSVSTIDLLSDMEDVFKTTAS
ncbi:hypothetical protein PHYPSEUDO_013204 [Phytophthora pseudosyringae]|uniref:Uncharacterized protein n=1 Tax=Phytophthora pseudosyringae TaxID=221518 RepID=A0A8T1VAH4_9STRA|nr:hypothetical protein PHYPSEUDO_013204 [Phytophthora pseudosyringae]